MAATFVQLSTPDGPFLVRISQVVMIGPRQFPSREGKAGTRQVWLSATTPYLVIEDTPENLLKLLENLPS